MIVGTGVDMCEIAPVARALEARGERFLRGLFTPAEQADAGRSADPAARFAGLFAAKEACAKALGLGFADGLRWTEIEILPGPDGSRVALTGAARAALDRLTPSPAGVRISWRDQGPFALAVAVIEAA